MQYTSLSVPYHASFLETTQTRMSNHTGEDKTANLTQEQQFAKTREKADIIHFRAGWEEILRHVSYTRKAKRTLGEGSLDHELLEGGLLESDRQKDQDLELEKKSRVIVIAK